MNDFSSLACTNQVQELILSSMFRIVIFWTQRIKNLLAFLMMWRMIFQPCIHQAQVV